MGLPNSFNGTSRIQSGLDSIKEAAGFGSKSPLPPGPNKPVTDLLNGIYIQGVSDLFLKNYNIDGSDFNKIYGYQLAIIDNNFNTIAEFTFPINPTNISITVPTASNLSVTMKGITEDHNGAPLRMISFSGTTGVMPSIVPQPSPSSTPTGILNSLFKNTIQQVGRTINAFNTVINDAKSIFGGGAGISMPLNYTSGSDSEILKTNSGYTMAHTLVQFLENYLAAKKDKKNAKLRLQFRMHKDKMHWTSTLTNYSFRKNPGTLEYEYTINLTAWRRDAIDRAPKQSKFPSYKNLNTLSQIIKTIRDTRKLVNQSVTILSGIRADIDQSLLTPLREIILLGSDITGATKTLLDFPHTLINNCRSSIEKALLDSHVNNAGQNAALDKYLIARGVHATNVSSTPLSLGVSAAINSPIGSMLHERELRGEADIISNIETSSAFEEIFRSPEEHQDVIDIDIDSLVLSQESQNAMSDEIDRVNTLTISDLRSKRDKIKAYAESISEALGGGSATYNRINGLPAVKQTYKTLSTDDIEILSNLNDLLQMIDSFISFALQDQTTGEDEYSNFYAEMARSNGLTFADNKSKFFVPFPYGASLESLAVQYLGDVNRWIEIAAINGLKQPYIDEDGFEVNFLSSGSGSIAIIASADNLFVGQLVQILSDTQAPTARHIKSIEVISEIESVLIFDGEANLSNYLKSDNARLKAYLPDTVNSLKMIAIPSESAVNVPDTIKLTPSGKDLDIITQIAKIDILLQSDGDIALTSSGDFVQAVGMQNLVQAAKMRLLTSLGSILTDPSFGNPIQAGQNVADINSKQLINMLNASFADDPRYTGVMAARANIIGPVAKIDLLLGIANSGVFLPITTQVPL